jgi:hypothetical protein
VRDSLEPVGDHPPGETLPEVVARVRRDAPIVVDAELRRRAGLSWLEYAILIVLIAERDDGATVPQLATRLRISSETARRLTRDLLVRGDLLPASAAGADGLLTVSGDGRARALVASEHYLQVVREQIATPLTEVGIGLHTATAVIAAHDPYIPCSGWPPFNRRGHT